MAANNYQNAVAQNWVQGMFDVNKTLLRLSQDHRRDRRRLLLRLRPPTRLGLLRSVSESWYQQNRHYGWIFPLHSNS
jgi:hypothetical protein